MLHVMLASQQLHVHVLARGKGQRMMLHVLHVRQLLPDLLSFPQDSP